MTVTPPIDRESDRVVVSGAPESVVDCRDAPAASKRDAITTNHTIGLEPLPPRLLEHDARRRPRAPRCQAASPASISDALLSSRFATPPLRLRLRRIGSL